MSQTTAAVDERARAAGFASEVVRFLADLGDERPLGTSLSLPFGLSASMRRHGLGLEDTVAAILSLRAALLSVPGLDAASEPRPLRVPDRVLFVLNLAVYLDGLLGRAALVLGVSRREAADVAVELLASA